MQEVKDRKTLRSATSRASPRVEHACMRSLAPASAGRSVFSHHLSVLPKGRSSTANSGTKVAVLLGMNRCGSFSLLSAPHSLSLSLSLSLASEQILKDPRGPNVEVTRVNLANWAPPNFTEILHRV